MLSSPPPPTPDQLRSIQHVCKCKECYHPPPHPPLTSCVASNMCASARNVITPPPPTPDQLRSIQHVCKCKECYHPPPHPPVTSCVASNMCASARNVIIPPPHPPLTSCVASNMCAKWGEMSKCAQKPTAFCEPWANCMSYGKNSELHNSTKPFAIPLATRKLPPLAWLSRNHKQKKLL